MALWMDSGTVSVTNGSKTVTGTGTAFKTSAIPARPGQPIILPGGICEIGTVDSDTQMTLAKNYQGNSGATEPYVVVTTFEGSYNDLARRAAQVMGSYQTYMDSYAALLGGSGVVHVVLPDGSEHDLIAWQDLLSSVIQKNKSFGLGARQGDSTNNALAYTENTTRDFNQLVTQGEYTIEGLWANGTDNGAAAVAHEGIVKVRARQSGDNIGYVQNFDNVENGAVTSYVRTGVGTFPNVTWSVWELGDKKQDYQASRRLLLSAEGSTNNGKLVSNKKDLPATATQDIKLHETLITAGSFTPVNNPEQALLAGSETWVLDKDKKKSKLTVRSRNFETATFGMSYSIGVDSFSITRADSTLTLEVTPLKAAFGVPLEAAATKSSIKVNNQSSLSFQDQGNAVFHVFAYGSSLKVAAGLNGEIDYLALASSGTLTQQKDIVTIAATARSWSSYNVANYRCSEMTGMAGNLHAAVSYPFKITGLYALDAYLGTYADGPNANSLYQVFGFTDGGSYTPSWGFASGGFLRYWSAPSIVGTIASSSPMAGPSFTPTSDARLKPVELRESLETASDMLRQLTPLFYFKRYSLDTDQGFFEFGFVADEVEKIEPRLVTESDDEHKLKGLSDKGIVTHVVKGWQEHDERLKALETLMANIDARLKAAGI